MQRLSWSLLRRAVRPLHASVPSRGLRALGAASTLALSACGVSYSSPRNGGSSETSTSENQTVGLTDVDGKRPIVVDDSDPGFRLYVEPGYHELDRSPEAWSRVLATVESGVGADLLTAPVGYLDGGASGGPTGRSIAAIALWEASLPPGIATYEVYAFLKPSADYSQSASYCFSMGTTDEDQETQDCGLVDQSSGEGGWRLLTTLPLTGRAQVWLDPGATLETGKQVMADAVKFVPTIAD